MQGEPDAHPDVDHGAADVDGLGHRRHHPVGHGHGQVGFGQVVEQQGELVAAQPGHQVTRADGLAQAPGHHVQEGIAGRRGPASR